MSSAPILARLIANLATNDGPFGIRVPQSWPLLVHMSLPAFDAGPFRFPAAQHPAQFGINFIRNRRTLVPCRSYDAPLRLSKHIA